MFSCEILYDYPVREISIPVSVSCTECPEMLTDCLGIVDTGATASMISADIAKALSLRPNGRITVNGVHGSQAAYTYLADVSFGNGAFTFRDLPVSEADNNAGFDFLIGMDILGQGCFSFCRVERGMYVFRFSLNQQ